MATLVENAIPEKPIESATLPSVIFFDCDDCLYKNDWRVAQLLTAKIDSFCSDKLSMRSGHAYELYKKWGTCLRGMQQENIIDDDGHTNFPHIQKHRIPFLFEETKKSSKIEFFQAKETE